MPAQSQRVPAPPPNRAQRRSRRKADQPESGPLDGERLVDARFIATLLGSGESQARRVMRELTRIQIAKKCVRVKLCDLQAWLAAREVSPVAALTR